MSNPHNRNSVAILVFARSPEAESSIKIISENNTHNLLLWEALHKKLTKTLHNSNLPYFIFDETQQKGTVFGKKVANAINQVFGHGFEKVLLVGNDCPELTSKHLIKAAGLLFEKNMVIGPDFGGGAYLIGVTKKCFDAKKFSQLPWQTPSIFQSLLCYCNNEEIALLPRLFDLNSKETISKAAQRLKKLKSLKKVLFSCFYNSSPVVMIIGQMHRFFYDQKPFNKGSPLKKPLFFITLP